MQNGIYITPSGDKVEVLDFDPINKMVYTPLPNGNFAWIHDCEYSKWVKEGGEPTIEEQVEELAAKTDEPKKKRTTKKKEE